MRWWVVYPLLCDLAGLLVSPALQVMIQAEAGWSSRATWEDDQRGAEALQQAFVSGNGNKNDESK